MQVSKETIWHFTCSSCSGYWSIATMDDWNTDKLYSWKFFCPHCGEKANARKSK